VKESERERERDSLAIYALPLAFSSDLREEQEDERKKPRGRVRKLNYRRQPPPAPPPPLPLKPALKENPAKRSLRQGDQMFEVLNVNEESAIYITLPSFKILFQEFIWVTLHYF